MSWWEKAFKNELRFIQVILTKYVGEYKMNGVIL